MARYRPSFKLQQELKIAQAREDYQTEFYNQFPMVATVNNRKMIYAAYHGLFFDEDYVVKVSDKSATEFGGLDNLGLVNTEAIMKNASLKPDNITPSMVKMTYGATEPTARKAYNKNYGSRVINYARDTTGGQQAHFTAPISDRGAATTQGETPTAVNIEAVRAKAYDIATAKKTAIGDYGRFYFVLEKVSVSLRQT